MAKRPNSVIDRIVKENNSALVFLRGKRDIVPVPSGIDAVDSLTGVGGLPESRVTVYVGGQSSGKTTAGLLAIAECQKRGGLGIFLDFEGKLSTSWASSLGVDLDNLVLAVSTMDKRLTIEAAFELIESVLLLMEKEAEPVPVVVVWDSLQSAPTADLVSKVYGSGAYGPESQAYSKAHRRFGGCLSQPVTLIFISQERVNIDAFGDDPKIGVGKAWDHWPSLVLLFKKSKKLATGDGNLVRIRSLKNHIGGEEGEVVILAFRKGEGFCPAQSLLEAAKRRERVSSEGAWYRFDTGEAEPKRIHGLGGLRTLALSDPDAFEALRKQVLRKEVEGECPAQALLAEAERRGRVVVAGSWFSFDVGSETPCKIQGLGKLKAFAQSSPEDFEVLRKAVLRDD